MKKIIYFVAGILLIGLVGCGEMENTPTKQVEAFLSQYQKADKNVIDDLDSAIDEQGSLSEEQRSEYRDMMKKHYQDLKYEIKDEVIDGNNATVTVEIEVNDYSKVLQEAETYRQDHEEEFTTSNGEYDETKFIEYRLKKMKDVNEKVKYTLDLTLTKDTDEKWVLDNLTTADEQKINGTYAH